jgi:hypothetical protein
MKTHTPGDKEVRKKIDLNVSLTPNQCGCGNGGEQRTDGHPAGAEHVPTPFNDA